MQLPPLMVLRHGQTEWNREGRMQGALDSPLTRQGVAHARRQGAILAGLAVGGWAWRHSPQGRARATAEIAAAGTMADLIPDDRLREIGLGKWAGLLRDDLVAAQPALFEGGELGWYDHAPAGEGLAALAARCMSFLADLSGPTVVVTHGITSRVLRCLAMGLPYEAFDTLQGGQGVVYEIREGHSHRHT